MPSLPSLFVHAILYPCILLVLLPLPPAMPVQGRDGRAQAVTAYSTTTGSGARRPDANADGASVCTSRASASDDAEAPAPSAVRILLQRIGFVR